MTTGRKLKISKKIKQKFFEAIEIGLSYKSACAYSNISESSLYRWIKQGESDQESDIKSKQRTFFEELSNANSSVEIELIREIKASNDWRAKAFILERRFKKDWGQSAELNLKEEGTKKEIVYDVSKLSKKELSELLGEEDENEFEDC